MRGGSPRVTFNEEVVDPCSEAERWLVGVKEKPRSMATHLVSMRFEVFQKILLRHAAGIVHAVDGVVDFK